MISGAKGEWFSPIEYSTTVDSYIKSVVLEVYKEYVWRLRDDNALDFDDLLLFFRQILDHEEVLEYFHTRFTYFMVDEYQDTNLLQYEIVKILASKARNLCVVGDDWQGIYSWRWANIENILSFKKDYPEAKVINLEENYRSTKIIIEAANAVIKNNTNQMKKTLFTNNPQGEKIRLLDGLDEKHEAEMIVNAIREIFSGNTSNSEEENSYARFAVLYRTNGQSRLIEESLIRKNIPYRVYGWVKFYERKEVKDILAYIRIIFNPYDSMSLKRIINVPGRKIWEKSLENFLDVLTREHLTIKEMCENDFLLDSLTWIGAKWLQSFCILYKFFLEASKTQSVAEVMKHIIDRTWYEDYLKNEYSEEEFEWKMDNLQEFQNMASRYDGLIYPENFAQFLEDIALITDQDRNQEDKEKEERWHVSLMTVHLAKGLEYPTVFIAWAEEGIFPHSRSLVDGSALEEERRLMYVAITRAKESLYISRAHERYTFGNYSANPKSRFIKEIPPECISIDESRNLSKSIFGNWENGLSGMNNLFSRSGWDPAFTPRAIKPKNDKLWFAIWDRIKHPQYGVWTIITLDDAIANIAFPGMGVKKMNIEIAPIEKIDA